MEIYLLDVSALSGREPEALSLLTPARRERALRMAVPETRRQCIGAGLLLRAVYGDREPERGPMGKPFFPGERPFSLAHSGRWAALAADDGELGLDVERLAPVRESLPARVLTQTERRWLADAGEDGFSFLWTRKEAALKLLGVGLGSPLREFSVLPGEESLPGGRKIAAALEKIHMLG